MFNSPAFVPSIRLFGRPTAEIIGAERPVDDNIQE
jgi:hypothetical protein